jgi:hypothetical protein
MRLLRWREGRSKNAGIIGIHDYRVSLETGYLQAIENKALIAIERGRCLPGNR